MSSQDKSLLLLCGETAQALGGYSIVVCLSLARQLSLQKHGITTLLFSDFGPGEAEGARLDQEVFEHLDQALHDEAACNQQLRWAPLCYIPIQYRLSRYLWLKNVLRKMLTGRGITHLCLSSRQDFDLVAAATAVGKECGCMLEIDDGTMDVTTSINYTVRLHGLPTTIDPPWLVRLRWRLWRWFHGRRSCIAQPYWNLELAEDSVFVLKIFSAINLLGRVGDKIRSALRMNRHAGEQNPIPEAATPRTLGSRCWQQWFQGDEILLATNILDSFVADYPPELLDRAKANLVIALGEIGARKVLLMNDRLDASRLLAFAARQLGATVDYLPHGLILEDYSGRKTHSPYLPQRVLAWNAGSQRAFADLGWPAVAVRHPQYAAPAARFRPLRKPRAEWRVLVLIAEWICVSQSGREDCAVVDLLEVRRGLLAAGIPEDGIHAKFHSATEAGRRAKELGLSALQAAAGSRITLVPSHERTTKLIPCYDLVIMGPTSGIYEAVIAGVPLIVFGTAVDRVGALRDMPLPVARNAAELTSLIARYDNAGQEAAFGNLAESLRNGADLLSA